jgi:regulator of sigma E protease
MISLLSAVVVLGILVFVHELGHFLLCKLLGVGVEKFSLGFGTKVVGFRRGETEYLLSALPLGGYVKMFGEAGSGEEIPEEEKHRTFMGKSPFKRILIVAAGPIFNLVFAWLVMILIHLLGVPSATTKIGEVLKDKPAARAGLLAGDHVATIDGKAVARWSDLYKTIATGKGEPITLVVKRGDKNLTFTLKPELRSSKNLFGEATSTPAIGIVSAGEIFKERFGPVEAVVKGTTQTLNLIDMTIVSLAKMVERVVPLDSVGGPIMIAKMAGEQAAAGGVSFLAFMALLSINLGVLNLLPIPVLDGGHLLFYTMEMIFRRPVSMKVREVAQQIGLLLLMGLMVMAFYNDVVRYFLKQG